MVQQEEAEEDHPFLSHLSELLHRVRVSLLVTVILFGFFFLFEPRRLMVSGLTLYYPFPSLFASFSTVLFGAMKSQLLPPEMVLINLNPFDSFTASVYIALALALVPSLPVWIYEIGGFILPALTSKEKRLMRWLLIPSTLLFIAGMAFAYFVVLPFLFRFLLYFTLAFHALPTVSIMSFIGMVLAYMVALGVAFELPVVVAGLSYAGIVRYQAWLHYWRHAVVVSFFISLVISPPGATGGIIETTIGLLLSALYFAGALVARTVSQKDGVSREVMPPQ